MKNISVIMLLLFMASPLFAQEGMDSIPTLRPKNTDASMVKIPREDSKMPILNPEENTKKSPEYMVPADRDKKRKHLKRHK